MAPPAARPLGATTTLAWPFREKNWLLWRIQRPSKNRQKEIKADLAGRASYMDLQGAFFKPLMIILGGPANQKQAFLVNKLSKSPVSAVEPVPDSMNGLNIGWIGWYILQFLPQVGDVAVHRPGVQIAA